MPAPTLGLHWQTHNRTAFEARAAMAIDTVEDNRKAARSIQ